MARRVIIVGGGLAGLSCALRLHEGGAQPLVLEASDGVGGRVRSDEVEGFVLDRGFQVYLDAYPTAGRLLDHDALELRRFRPGALLFRGGKRRRVMDVFRCPQHFLGTALRGVGSFNDKLLVGKLRSRLRRLSVEEIARHEDKTTVEFLREFGFSEPMIDGFFRPFYGGIFLERELRTSSRMFEFTFKMFAEGSATLPARGMRAIPEQLAARLPGDALRLKAEVRSVDAAGVELASGERIDADAVVLATDAATAARLDPDPARPAIDWRAVTGLYFAAPRSPLREAIIALNTGSGLVNNICVPSDLAPGYAPEGESLISISVLGEASGDALPAEVWRELRGWFGAQVDSWRHLRTDLIRHALPEQPPVAGELSKPFRRRGGITVCGDHCSSASIEGAIVSGTRAAEAVLGELER